MPLLFQFGLTLCFLIPGLAAVLAPSEGGALSGGSLRRFQQFADMRFSMCADKAAHKPASNSDRANSIPAASVLFRFEWTSAHRLRSLDVMLSQVPGAHGVTL